MGVSENQVPILVSPYAKNSSMTVCIGAPVSIARITMMKILGDHTRRQQASVKKRDIT